ncbi:MAG TPA: S41 family peptidase [Chthoniobacterales bacterium]|nr:S41 family peptidase [Chthoniobacterales bacterium]
MAHTQPSPAPLSSEQKKAVLEKVIEEISAEYVHKEAADKIERHLREQIARDAYKPVNDEESFAKMLTGELRRIGNDEHLEVVVHRPEPPANPPRDPNAWIDELRLRNFDFGRLATLSGNVRYLELHSFPPPEVAGETAAASMRFLAGADAVIIDVRRNGGGTGEMAAFLATYFFEQRTALVRTFRRVENSTTEDRTLAHVPGPKMPTADLFILTSASTFSAAEAFAFSLQQLKRATVVGEKTRGGANAGRYRPATDRFRVFVPIAHATSAATGKTWDKIGIEPDIKVEAGAALNVAHREALSRLAQKASGAGRKKELEWMIEVVRAKEEPKPRRDLRMLTGRYGPHMIALEGEQLLHSQDAGPRWPLVEVANETFVIDSLRKPVRITFGGKGPEQRIDLEYSDGRKVEFKKESGIP